uniref:Uncharacterized protein n=1 Tax=Rhizophora mucronata TaxID=61149 RepID=A0A2P2QMW9_RHIMU
MVVVASSKNLDVSMRASFASCCSVSTMGGYDQAKNQHPVQGFSTGSLMYLPVKLKQEQAEVLEHMHSQLLFCCVFHVSYISNANKNGKYSCSGGLRFPDAVAH